MVCPLVITKARPCSTPSIARVTINDGTLVNREKYPFTFPTIRPMARTITTPAQIGSPRWMMSSAAMVPARAWVEPIARSISPPISKIVNPTAMIPTTELCRAMLVRFCTVMKYGLAKLR